MPLIHTKSAMILDGDNSAVASAQPFSDFGLHHGPILPGVPKLISKVNTRVCDAVVDSSNKMCGSTFKTNGAVSLSLTVPTFIIDYQRHHMQYYRHLREKHPGSATFPSRSNPPLGERVAREKCVQHQSRLNFEPALTGSSIRKWVLSGGWRDARYLVEPGRGPSTSLIGRYADELERLACVTMGHL